ncbi:heterokaryon incompatibility protein-domain-containing protein [Whalleya microplaca]|nr:heterokaryon incompatibility protein-domain-containing protein [Whalleya microplaca]
MSRSLSTRAQQLNRRVSSIRSSHHLCESCLNLNIQFTPDHERNHNQALNGVVLGKLQFEWRVDRCTLCQIFSRMAGDTCPHAGPFSRVELRGFPLLPCLTGQFQDYKPNPDAGLSEWFLVVMPESLTLFPRGMDQVTLDRMVSKQGFLVYIQETTPRKRLVMPRLVSPQFNPAIVEGWLRVCKNHHKNCTLSSRRPQPSLNLIDCRSRQVVSWSSLPSDSTPEYVALSYIWGQNDGMAKVAMKGSTLPQRLPRVIEDAINVVMALGCHYIFVDKYCVDQRNNIKKHEQIMHMDSVYQNAALTIVAAAGTDENYGLPGISRMRPTRQVFFQGDGFSLMSTLPLPHTSIANSRWATRGWTYQEALLSRRRLVFTDEQLYFECNSMSCCESLEISIDDNFSDSRSDSDILTRPMLFSLQQPRTCGQSGGKATRLGNFMTYVQCAEQYSQRTLSFDSDSLNAFAGIIRKLESVEMFPVHHIWGVPLFHPDDDDLSPDMLQLTYKDSPTPPFLETPPLSHSIPMKRPSSGMEQVNYLGFLMVGLCWRHNHSTNYPRRRNNLPSWSWVGWEGAVTWPDVSKASDIRLSTWPETTISLEGDITQSIFGTCHKSTNAKHLAQGSKSLYIHTSPMSCDAFIFDVHTRTLGLSTGGTVKLYPSKQGLDTSKVFDRIQSKRYEVIKLATANEATYLMLIKRYRHSSYRIGTLVVKDWHLQQDLFASNIKTFKLR